MYDEAISLTRVRFLCNNLLQNKSWAPISLLSFSVNVKILLGFPLASKNRNLCKNIYSSSDKYIKQLQILLILANCLLIHVFVGLSRVSLGYSYDSEIKIWGFIISLSRIKLLSRNILPLTIPSVLHKSFCLYFL